MQKVKGLLGILAIGLIVTVSLSAQSGTYQGQVIQPDGKILIWGNNLIISGVPAGMVARLNSNGSRDGSFNFCGCQFLSVNRLMLQPDGKILVSGNKVNGGSPFQQQRLVRINADGSADNTFTPYDGTAASFVSLTVEGVQPDGKILAYTLVDGGFPFGASTSVLRLNPSGTLDGYSLFVGTGHFLRVYMGDLHLLPDGKFYVSSYPVLSPSGTATLKKYNADGTQDGSFAPPVFLTGFNIVNSIYSQPNGDVMAAGGFTQMNGVLKKNIARLSSAGVVDPTFVPPANTLSVGQIEGLPSGKYLILEQATTSPATYVIRRLNTDGSLDGTFIQSPSVASVSSTFSLDAQGRIVFVGNHTTQGNKYYRLNPDGDLDESFNFGFKRPDFDFDGDGRSDVSLFRPSNGNWYLSQSQSGLSTQNFGLNGDVITPGDFDDDGRTDLAVFRPSTGVWWYKNSNNGGFYAVQWGGPGDIPLAEDFNGDGRDDFVIFRPANSTWYRLGSNGDYSPLVFGTTGDIPLVADMDGDGKADATIYRPSTGTWWYASSINGLFYAVQWGGANDIPVPGDYDADGKTDPAYFRVSDGAWFILQSSTNYTTYTGTFWGMTDDVPVAADYDGDGKTDLAVYRPSNAMWFVMRSTQGFYSANFGVAGDVAVPNAFLP